MKKTILKLTSILLIVVGSFSSCKEKELLEVQLLVNTKWKLVGIVDVQTGILTELEPQDCNECYTIEFDPDNRFFPECVNTFSGRMVDNGMWGCYEIDYKTGVLHLTNIFFNQMGSIWGGYETLYHQILKKIQSFTVKNTYPRILHLYYNDGKNYLKYKETVL